MTILMKCEMHKSRILQKKSPLYGKFSINTANKTKVLAENMYVIVLLMNVVYL